MLITGREREYFSHFIKNEAYDPAGVSNDTIDEYVRCYSGPGGLRCILEIYRATLRDGELNRRALEEGGKLKCPVLAVGSTHFNAEEVRAQREKVSEGVEYVELGFGYQLAEECPKELSEVYESFLEKHS